MSAEDVKYAGYDALLPFKTALRDKYFPYTYRQVHKDPQSQYHVFRLHLATEGEFLLIGSKGMHGCM
jgi:hypothetical protein